MGYQVNEKKKREKERKKERKKRKKKEGKEKEIEKEKRSKVIRWVNIQQVRKTRRQVFLYKAYYAKHWGVLLRKHCKEGASVATQFLTHVLINFQKNSKIAKNIENKKKYIFNTFASFLAFLASSQKNLNFQRYLERVQILTHYF